MVRTVSNAFETGRIPQAWILTGVRGVGMMEAFGSCRLCLVEVKGRAGMASYDVFYKKLISAVPLKNVTSRFAMEKIKSVTALPVPAA